MLVCKWVSFFLPGVSGGMQCQYHDISHKIFVYPKLFFFFLRQISREATMCRLGRR